MIHLKSHKICATMAFFLTRFSCNWVDQIEYNLPLTGRNALSKYFLFRLFSFVFDNFFYYDTFLQKMVPWQHGTSDWAKNSLRSLEPTNTAIFDEVKVRWSDMESPICR